MPLVSINQLSIRYRGPALLDDVSFTIERNQRIGLLGRNGAGKSTLLKILSGQVVPDHGAVELESGARIALLQQDVPDGDDSTIRGIVASGWIAEETDDESHEWKRDHATDQILSRMELDGEAVFRSLSSGMKRRALLAKALVSDPDLLLLDEPTNHLDIDAIDWLEGFLEKWQGAILFVTHDRAFLRKIAKRILEIDRGNVFDWTCDYDTFLTRKEQQLAAEEKQNALFDKRLAEEEAWIRKGIKARRTRNEGRVRALKEMRQVRAERQETVATSDMVIQEASRSGTKVIEAKQISFAYGDAAILKDFSITMLRGDKIGIIGPNGVGKSTLLKLLLKQLDPSEGQVKHGANIQIAYFDQLREQLNEDQSVIDNVGDGYDFVQRGESKKHVIGYLQEFLFTPDRARTEVRYLSGGERNRILLAKLFAKPANLIVMDEPTNDLDAETLEMLEERLVDYQGTLILVSHDREFLNNVVTSSVVFDRGTVKEYVGGYDDWLRQRPAMESVSPRKEKTKPATDRKPANQDAPRKLKFKEQKELEELPARIEKLETEIASLHELMADPKFYQSDGDEIAKQQSILSDAQSQLDSAYRRWEELETIASG